MKTLDTERLILRAFKMTDIDDFFEYCKMETVGPNAGWMPHTSKEISKSIIKKFLEKGDVWAIYHRIDNKVIGSVGLHKKVDSKTNETFYEIGYVLSTTYEGVGLMTETVKSVIKHAFIDLNLKEIKVCHFLENDKSRRVIEKCNFRYLKNIKYITQDFGEKVSRFYTLSREEYLLEQ
ncbi:MAG: GNAT family N-acetyltransferase [Tenericutes bacterium]|nr:GNAT family N-acetyltransferase [Mycoplasmatota bacterium]